MSVGILSVGSASTNQIELENVHFFYSKELRMRKKKITAQGIFSDPNQKLTSQLGVFFDACTEVVILGWGDSQKQLALLKQLTDFLKTPSNVNLHHPHPSFFTYPSIKDARDVKVAYIPMQHEQTNRTKNIQVEETVGFFYGPNETNEKEHILYYWGIEEKELNMYVRKVSKKFPKYPIEIHSEDGYLKVRFDSDALSQQIMTQLISLSNRECPESFIGEIPLSQKVKILLSQKKYLFTAAESLTGGSMMSYLSKEPGISSFFEGGIVTYSERVKQENLHVSEETLHQFGVVSSQCAKEMAGNVRLLFKADISVSLTGVAGPDSLEGHPSGVVWIGLSEKGKDTISRKFLFPFDREENRHMSVLAASNMLRLRLEGKKIPNKGWFMDS